MEISRLVRAWIFGTVLCFPLGVLAQAVAPRVKCEISNSAWCIAEGADLISRRVASDSQYDRIWTLQGTFRPSSQLLVFEPNGCRSNFSDVIEFVSYEPNYAWQHKKWDRLQIRLNSKGSCDLEILLTPDTNDPLEWAFSEGLGLIRACASPGECTGVSIAQLKPQFESQFHRNRFGSQCQSCHLGSRKGTKHQPRNGSD